jgi:hypothetical protein
MEGGNGNGNGNGSPPPAKQTVTVLIKDLEALSAKALRSIGYSEKEVEVISKASCALPPCCAGRSPRSRPARPSDPPHLPTHLANPRPTCADALPAARAGLPVRADPR